MADTLTAKQTQSIIYQWGALVEKNPEVKNIKTNEEWNAWAKNNPALAATYQWLWDIYSVLPPMPEPSKSNELESSDEKERKHTRHGYHFGEEEGEKKEEVPQEKSEKEKIDEALQGYSKDIKYVEDKAHRKPGPSIEDATKIIGEITTLREKENESLTGLVDLHGKPFITSPPPPEEEKKEERDQSFSTSNFRRVLREINRPQLPQEPIRPAPSMPRVPNFLNRGLGGGRGIGQAGRQAGRIAGQAARTAGQIGVRAGVAAGGALAALGWPFAIGLGLIIITTVLIVVLFGPTSGETSPDTSGDGGGVIEGSGRACTQPFEGTGYCSVDNLKSYFGNNEKKALTASLICQAESGSNPNALNNNCNTNDYSIGLFQINLVGQCAGAYGSGRWGTQSCDNLLDINKRNYCEQQWMPPEGNIQKMVIASSQGTNWYPWGTFTAPQGGRPSVQDILTKCGIQ